MGMYAYLSECALSHVTGIGLSENGVAISRNNLASLKSGPEVIGDSLVAKIVANGSLHLCEPVQDFLIGKTVERTSKTVETSSDREHGGAESRTNQVSSVCADVATLVVGVDGEVESHQFDEVVVLAETELVGEIERVILVFLDRGNLSTLEDVLVDSGSNCGELGNQVHGILEGVAPVFGLLHSLSIRLSERRFVLKSGDSEGELCHWVEVAWASVDEFLDEFGNFGTGGPLGGEVADLLLAGNLTSQEEPEKAF